MKWSGTNIFLFVFFICFGFLFVLFVLFCFFFHVDNFSGNLFRFL